jgi:hypothetical protein
MLSRWQGAGATIVVVLTAIGLVAGDVADGGFRRWWLTHALTTDTVAGLLVLLITVLVADQVVRIRQFSARSRAVAAQAVIMTGQAFRAAHAVCGAVAGAGDREEASDETRTYMLMLLVGAPILIDAQVSRAFLEESQRLGGEMARALTALRPGRSHPSESRPSQGQPSKGQHSHEHDVDRVNQALERVRSASAPLVASLNLDELIAAGAPAPAGGTPGGAAGGQDVR